jgi:hypothetical protein
MDDFSISTLHESRNEWCSRLITILTPLIIDGYKSIMEESLKLCKDNGELDKYLMTFQNFISRIPKWNPTIIETERKRICEKSGCGYLEDLVTCVHVIQLKIMTAMRVGQKQKKIDINIPKLDDFIHKSYINIARKVYKNVYLFEIGIPPLQIQKNNRELEIIVQECILNTIRESIPVEAILKAYMDESVETDVTEEIKEQYIEEAIQKGGSKNEKDQIVQSIIDDPEVIREKKLTFDDTDYVKDSNNNITPVIVPKTVENLEKINADRRAIEAAAEQEDNVKLKIFDGPDDPKSNLIDDLEIHNIEEKKMDLLPELLSDDIEFEVLE